MGNGGGIVMGGGGNLADFRHALKLFYNPPSLPVHIIMHMDLVGVEKTPAVFLMM